MHFHDPLDVRIVSGPFDPGFELDRFSARMRAAGGIVSFLGKVRDDDDVEELEIRHYAPMTLAGMETLARTAARRWPLDGLLLLHRVGTMAPGEPIVLVAAAARHRRDAFAAADFAMDHLKSESWFWKREKKDGAWRWIEPREQDLEDIARWG